MALSKIRTAHLYAMSASPLPIALLLMLWLGLFAGNISWLWNPNGVVSFVGGLRALSPLAAGAIAILVISSKLPQQRPQKYLFWGPLGFLALYGLAGIISSSLSPNPGIALYWALAYLSVPVVLWGVAWGTDPLPRVIRVLNFTWLVVILLTMGLFTLAMLYLELGSAIISPSILEKCNLDQPWIAVTREIIRPTGVGRVAAIAAIVALSSLYRRKWSLIWVPILMISLMLLFTSGARTSIGGFVLGAGLMALLYAGKRMALIATVALVAIGSLVWYTNIADDFLSQCLFRSWEDQSPRKASTPPTTKLIVVPPILSSPATTVQEGSPAQGALPRSTQPTTTVQKGPPVQGDQPRSEASTPRTKTVQESSPVEDSPVQLDPVPPGPPRDPKLFGLIPKSFFQLTGRRAVWVAGWDLFKESPFLGYGFHADRMLLQTHMHNAYMHSLIQTGILGTVPFIAALIFAWVLFAKALRNLRDFSKTHTHIIIMAGGLLAFFSVRSIPESTGAFFGVDWLLLSPLLLYLQAVNYSRRRELDGNVRPV